MCIRDRFEPAQTVWLTRSESILGGSSTVNVAIELVTEPAEFVIMAWYWPPCWTVKPAMAKTLEEVVVSRSPLKNQVQLSGASPVAATASSTVEPTAAL